MKFDDVSKEMLVGKVASFQTDTILGLSALADDEEGIDQIREMKQRKCKGFIILIPSIESLKDFDIELSDAHLDIVSKLWPGPVTIALKSNNNKFSYLYDDQNSLVFRLPNNPKVQEFLNKVGPVVSTSVNLSGEEPILTLDEAKKQFGDKIDYYIDEEIEHTGKPSSLIAFLR